VWALCVVAADTCVSRAPEVERVAELVRVGAGRGVDDRMRAIDDRELLIAPVGTLRALVGAIADDDRHLRESFPNVGCVEVELDHLPGPRGGC
jgi:hypothetical protein